MKVFTIGFTRKSAERFFDLLRDSGASRILDVRLNNGSQLAGFAKKNDLQYFLRALRRMEYIHLPQLAPTKELLGAYRKGRIDWPTYRDRFIELMRERKIEQTTPRDILNNGCLLCSEDQPHQCHRRLVVEYLDQKWGGIDAVHLGMRE